MLWMLPIAGAAIGAMLNKDKPLKGAAVGGLLGAGGAYALPAMGAMGGAAGASGAAAAAPAATAGASGASAAGAGQAGAAAGQGGLLSTFSQYAGPASQALNIAGQTKAMTQGQPMQAAPAQFQQGPGFAGLLNPTDQVDMEKRRQAQQMAVQGLLGGYGRNYG